MLYAHTYKLSSQNRKAAKTSLETAYMYFKHLRASW